MSAMSSFLLETLISGSCIVHCNKHGAEELCGNDPLKEQSLTRSQLRDDQYVPASLVSSASIAKLQTFKQPSRAAHDLSPGIAMATVLKKRNRLPLL